MRCGPGIDTEERIQKNRCFEIKTKLEIARSGYFLEISVAKEVGMRVRICSLRTFNPSSPRFFSHF